MQNKLLLNRIQSLSSPIQPEKTGHAIHLDAVNNVRCVAFDFYGTMFISSAGDIGIDENRDEGNIRFFEEALRACGFEILDQAAGKKGIKQFNYHIERHKNKMKINGKTHPEPDIRNVCRDLLADLHERKIIEGDVSKDVATLFVIEFEFRSNAIWPLPGLRTLLEQLKNRGITLGIISNSQFYSPLSFEAITGRSVKASGFDDHLQKWSYRCGIKKPSLSFYQLFVDELSHYNFNPGDVLYVGNDLFKDVVPAKTLGMKTALFVGDKRSIRHEPDELAGEQQPDIVVDELSQLEECIN